MGKELDDNVFFFTVPNENISGSTSIMVDSNIATKPSDNPERNKPHISGNVKKTVGLGMAYHCWHLGY